MLGIRKPSLKERRISNRYTKITEKTRFHQTEFFHLEIQNINKSSCLPTLRPLQHRGSVQR